MRRESVKNVGNGIGIKTKKRITLSNKIQISPMLIVIQYIISILGVYGTVFSFINGFGIEVDKVVLLVWIFIITIYFHIILRNTNLIKIFIFPTLILYVISIYKFFNEIKNGFWHIENYFIHKYNLYFETNIYNYIVDDLEPKYVLTIFFVFLIFILSYLISSVILHNIFRILFMFVTLPIVLLIFTVGYTPEYKAFGAYLLCVVFIFSMGTPMIANVKPRIRIPIIKHKSAQIPVKNTMERKFKYMVGLKVGGTCTLIILLLFGITSILFTPVLYNKYVNITDAKAKIQNEMMSFSLDGATDKLTFLDLSNYEIFPSKSGTAGINGGRLGTLSSVTYDYKTVLEIQMPNIADSLYLKGFVGSEYDGKSWNSLNKESQSQFEQILKIWEDTDFNITNQSSYVLSIIKDIDYEGFGNLEYSIGQIKVDNIGNQNYIFSPYYSVYPMDSKFIFKGQEYITSKKKQSSYEYQYYNSYNNMLEFNARNEYIKCLNHFNFGLDKNLEESEVAVLEKLNQYAKYEASYSEFVYDNYLAVPDNLKLRFDDLFDGVKNYRDRIGDESLIYVVDLIQTYLNSNTSYSLSPGVLPDNTDFVEYFLYENKVGYCTYYASAAAMMLRYFGVPSRYVEGYIVKESNINEGNEQGMATVKGIIDGEIKEYEVNYLTVEVPDANAHAWVEIYVDGFGWVPVEFTPGYIEINNKQAIKKDLNRFNHVPNTTRDLNDELSKNIDQNENTNKKDIDDKITPSKKPEEISDNSNQDEMGSYIGDGRKNSEFYRKLFELLRYFVCLCSFIILLIAIRYIFIQWKRAKDYKTDDFSKKVIMRFKDIKRILTYYQIIFDDQKTYDLSARQIEEKLRFIPEGKMVHFIHVVLKAKFDQNRITEAESDATEEFYSYFVDYLYKDSTLLKKAYMKFIKVI